MAFINNLGVVVIGDRMRLGEPTRSTDLNSDVRCEYFGSRDGAIAFKGLKTCRKS